jgi:hypothetical protein
MRAPSFYVVQAVAGACGRRLEGRHLSTNYTLFIHTGSSPAALSNGGIQAAGGWLSPSAGIHLFYQKSTRHDKKRSTLVPPRAISDHASRP